MQTNLDQITNLACARNSLDIKKFSATLAKNVLYEAQGKNDVIAGKAALLEYIQARFEFIRSLDASVGKGTFEIAKIDMPTELGCLCLAYLFKGKIQAVWLPTFDDNKLISRLNIITINPDPKTAKLLIIN
mgnify:CR=1 FL=1|jgi:hypothetical protein